MPISMNMMQYLPNVLQYLTSDKKPAPKKKVAVKKAVPVTTKKEEIRKIAQTKLKAHKPKGGGVVSAAFSGLNRWLPFEAGNRIVAAGFDLAGYGEHDDAGWDQKNFDNYMQILRRKADADYNVGGANKAAYALGGVTGALTGGLGTTKAIQGVGNLVAKAPKLAKVGKALAASQTLVKGQKAKNLGKLVLTGAGVGAAEGAVRNEGALKGAAIGAVGAPLAVGGMKLAGYLGRPAVDVFDKMKGKALDGFLRRITTATDADVQAARTAYKDATGAEPTLFEILPASDQQRISNLLGKFSPEKQSAVDDAIQGRARNVEGEMLNSVTGATAGSRNAAIKGFADDLATSRGDAMSSLDDATMAFKSSKSPLDLEIQQGAESRNIMAPFDDQIAYKDTSELIPQHPVTQKNGKIKMVESDPEVSAIIRNASGSLRLAKDVTVSQVQTIRQNIKANHKLDPNSQQKALNAIDDALERDHPDVLAAMSKMRDMSAAKYRTGEGFAEGSKGRTREQFTGDRFLGERAYDTAEGTTGRALGQTAALKDRFSGTPRQALGAVEEIAQDSGVRRAIAGNIDEQAAEGITAAAGAQEKGLRALANLKSATGKKGEEVSASSLGDLLLAANPASFPLTRMAAFGRLMKIPGLSDKKAQFLIDNLFSQNPTKISKAISLLDNAGLQGKQALRDMTAAATGASVTASGLADVNFVGEENPATGVETSAQGEPDYSKMSDEELMQAIQQEPDYSQMSDEELMQTLQQEGAAPSEGGNPEYAAQLENLYASESPEFLDLLQKVERQESGGNQGAVSSAGAIGVMQVMPYTAPEAAKMAGLPWDKQAYYNDENYNRLLGIAYLSEQLRDFDGDPVLALAAYNAGPQAVNDWINGKRKQLPAETRDYVLKIYGARI